MSPAEEKIRHVLETNAGRLRTEGPDVVRWLTGGSEPDAYLLLEREPQDQCRRSGRGVDPLADTERRILKK